VTHQCEPPEHWVGNGTLIGALWTCEVCGHTWQLSWAANGWIGLTPIGEEAIALIMREGS
jgi:hypothetical protein